MPIRLDSVVATCDLGRWLHRVNKDKSLRVVDSSMNGGEEVKTGSREVVWQLKREVKTREVLLVLYFLN